MRNKGDVMTNTIKLYGNMWLRDTFRQRGWASPHSLLWKAKRRD
jgi:hypothetical protein